MSSIKYIKYYGVKKANALQYDLTNFCEKVNPNNCLFGLLN